jgi:hypothetical protein
MSYSTSRPALKTVTRDTVRKNMATTATAIMPST